MSVRRKKQLNVTARQDLAGALYTSAAVKIYINQAVVDQGLPFVPKRSSKEIRSKWDTEVEEARKEKPYKTAKQAVRSVLK